MIPSAPYIDAAAWVRAWQRAGPTLARIRADELRTVDVTAFVHSMRDAFDAARARPASNATSGLVEQQRWFRRATR